MKAWGWLIVIVIILAAAAAGWYYLGAPSATTLSFGVRDALSHAWVWGATARLQNRSVHAFSQTDFSFTGLRPGSYTMTVEAPSYLPSTERVTIHRGEPNRAAQVDLVGYAIPGLAGFAVSLELTGGSVGMKLNPVNAEGRLVEEFPCLDIRVALRLSVQSVRGLPVAGPTAGGAEHGQELFDGVVGWQWDSSPDARYHYTVSVSAAHLAHLAAPIMVADWIVVVPDPLRITPGEVDRLMPGIMESADVASLAREVRPYLGRIEVYSSTIWNVRNKE